MLPITAAVLVAIGFIVFDFSGMVYISTTAWWWLLFQIASVLFVLFVMLGWRLRVDRRQPTRKFVA